MYLMGPALRPYRYLTLLLSLYALCLCLPRKIAVNSNWTRDRLPCWQPVTVIYPPCGKVERVKKKRGGKTLIVSLGQFRPEKNHRLQLEIMCLIFSTSPELRKEVEFVIIGGNRGTEDEKIVDSLKSYILENGMQNNTRIAVNISNEEKMHLLESAQIGLHTMVEEHFGIAVVEMIVRLSKLMSTRITE